MAAYSIAVTTAAAKVAINKPPTIADIVVLPTSGPFLFWRRADGAYYVVLP
jgi:hypothetical protein